jgi:hypothetical protein
MNNTVKTMMFGMVAMAGALAVTPAQAARVSLGLSVSKGGSALAVGVSNGGHNSPGGARHDHRQPHAPARIGVAYAHLPPPVVVAPVVVAPSGYWLEREERIWADGCWIETVDTFGRRVRQWQPARWEIRRTREWVQQ